MKNEKQLITIGSNIVKPIGAKFKGNFYHGHAIGSNPNYPTNPEAPKYIDLIFIKWAGMSKIIQRGCRPVLLGHFTTFGDYENEVFIVKEAREFGINEAKLQSNGIIPYNQDFVIT
jgi:hypothetical protein